MKYIIMALTFISIAVLSLTGTAQVASPTNLLDSVYNDAENIRYALDFERTYENNVFSEDYLDNVEEFHYQMAMTKEVIYIIKEQLANNAPSEEIHKNLSEVTGRLHHVHETMLWDRMQSKVNYAFADYCMEYWQDDIDLLIQVKQLI